VSWTVSLKLKTFNGKRIESSLKLTVNQSVGSRRFDRRAGAPTTAAAWRRLSGLDMEGSYG
jgi:hypothetical protein